MEQADSVVQVDTDQVGTDQVGTEQVANTELSATGQVDSGQVVVATGAMELATHMGITIIKSLNNYLLRRQYLRFLISEKYTKSHLHSPVEISFLARTSRR